MHECVLRAVFIFFRKSGFSLSVEICNDCFHSVNLEQQRQQDQTSAKRSSSQDDAAVDRSSESRSSTILAVVFAVVTMTAYAFISGLVEVKFTRTKDKESYSEESTPELAYAFEGEHQRNQSTTD